MNYIFKKKPRAGVEGYDDNEIVNDLNHQQMSNVPAAGTNKHVSNTQLEQQKDIRAQQKISNTQGQIPTDPISQVDVKNLQSYPNKLGPSGIKFLRAPGEERPGNEKNSVIRTSSFHENTVQRSFSASYKIKERLGNGFTSAVFLAISKDTPLKFSVKRLNKQIILKYMDEEDIQNEIIVMSTIVNQQLPAIIEVFSEPESIYVVQKYVYGDNILDSLSMCSKLNELDARDIIMQLLMIVDGLHAKNLIHRDIQFYNVKITSDSRRLLMLVDFGFAKFQPSIEYLKFGKSFDHVAPELLEGRAATKKTDTWGIGILAYLILGGYSPFFDWNNKMMKFKIQNATLLFHRGYWRHVSKDAMDFISQALKPNPNQRSDAKHLLNHPWICTADNILEKRDISPTLFEIRKYTLRRRFRSAMRALLFVNRISQGDFTAQDTIEFFPTNIVADAYLIKEVLTNFRAQYGHSLSETRNLEAKKMIKSYGQNQTITSNRVTNVEQYVNSEITHNTNITRTTRRKIIKGTNGQEYEVEEEYEEEKAGAHNQQHTLGSRVNGQFTQEQTKVIQNKQTTNWNAASYTTTSTSSEILKKQKQIELHDSQVSQLEEVEEREKNLMDKSKKREAVLPQGYLLISTIDGVSSTGGAFMYDDHIYFLPADESILRSSMFIKLNELGQKEQLLTKVCEKLGLLVQPQAPLQLTVSRKARNKVTSRDKVEELVRIMRHGAGILIELEKALMTGDKNTFQKIMQSIEQKTSVSVTTTTTITTNTLKNVVQNKDIEAVNQVTSYATKKTHQAAIESKDSDENSFSENYHENKSLVETVNFQNSKNQLQLPQLGYSRSRSRSRSRSKLKAHEDYFESNEVSESEVGQENHLFFEKNTQAGKIQSSPISQLKKPFMNNDNDDKNDNKDSYDMDGLGSIGDIIEQQRSKIYQRRSRRSLKKDLSSNMLSNNNGTDSDDNLKDEDFRSTGPLVQSKAIKNSKSSALNTSYVNNQSSSRTQVKSTTVNETTIIKSKVTSIEEMENTMMFSETNVSRRVREILASNDAQQLKSELQQMLQRYDLQRSLNAQQLMKIQSTQGNIQVFCRIRRPLPDEIGQELCVDSLSDTEIGFFEPRQNQWKSFAFDRVWGVNAGQQDIFQEIEPLALSVVNGYNACIFAYGQTGSGKTFTMIGEPTGGQFGLSYRIMHKIFDMLSFREEQMNNSSKESSNDVDSKKNMKNLLSAQIAATPLSSNYPSPVASRDSSPVRNERHSSVFQYSVQVAMVEIYNEQVRDLLNPTKPPPQLDIKHRPEAKMEIPGLIFEQIKKWVDVIDVFNRGTTNRSTTATDMNLHSSRSHCILIVDVTTIVRDGAPIEGRLYLVDLAGSENVNKSNVSGESLRQAKFINKSLSALGDVMEALDKKSAHVPYRNSNLTYLLQDALGGSSSRTAMVLAIRPTASHAHETHYALQFATRVRKISLPAAKTNISTKNLEENIKNLKKQLEEAANEKKELEKQIKGLKNENKESEIKFQQDMDANARALENRIRELQNEIENQKSGCAILEKRLQKEQDAKSNTQEQLYTQIDKLKRDNDGLAQDNRSLQQKIKEGLDREQNTQRSKNQTDVKFKGMEASIKKLEGDVATLQKTNANLQRQVKQEVQDREEKVEEKIREIWQLNEQIKSYEQELDNLHSELSKKNLSAQGIETQKAEMDSKVRSLQVMLREYEMEIQIIKNKNQALEIQLKKNQELNQERILTFRHENEEFQKIMEAKNLEIQKLMERLLAKPSINTVGDDTNEVASLQIVNSELITRITVDQKNYEQKITTLQQSLWEHKERLVESDRERDYLFEKIRSLETKLLHVGTLHDSYTNVDYDNGTTYQLIDNPFDSTEISSVLSNSVLPQSQQSQKKNLTPIPIPSKSKTTTLRSNLPSSSNSNHRRSSLDKQKVKSTPSTIVVQNQDRDKKSSYSVPRRSTSLDVTPDDYTREKSTKQNSFAPQSRSTSLQASDEQPMTNVPQERKSINQKQNQKPAKGGKSYDVPRFSKSKSTDSQKKSNGLGLEKSKSTSHQNNSYQLTTIDHAIPEYDESSVSSYVGDGPNDAAMITDFNQTYGSFNDANHGTSIGAIRTNTTNTNKGNQSTIDQIDVLSSISTDPKKLARTEETVVNINLIDSANDDKFDDNAISPTSKQSDYLTDDSRPTVNPSGETSGLNINPTDDEEVNGFDDHNVVLTTTPNKINEPTCDDGKTYDSLPTVYPSDKTNTENPTTTEISRINIDPTDNDNNDEFDDNVMSPKGNKNPRRVTGRAPQVNLDPTKSNLDDSSPTINPSDEINTVSPTHGESFGFNIDPNKINEQTLSKNDSLDLNPIPTNAVNDLSPNTNSSGRTNTENPECEETPIINIDPTETVMSKVLDGNKISPIPKQSDNPSNNEKTDDSLPTVNPSDKTNIENPTTKERSRINIDPTDNDNNDEFDDNVMSPKGNKNPRRVTGRAPQVNLNPTKSNLDDSSPTINPSDEINTVSPTHGESSGFDIDPTDDEEVNGFDEQNVAPTTSNKTNGPTGDDGKTDDSLPTVNPISTNIDDDLSPHTNPSDHNNIENLATEEAPTINIDSTDDDNNDEFDDNVMTPKGKKNRRLFPGKNNYTTNKEETPFNNDLLANINPIVDNELWIEGEEWEDIMDEDGIIRQIPKTNGIKKDDDATLNSKNDYQEELQPRQLSLSDHGQVFKLFPIPIESVDQMKHIISNLCEESGRNLSPYLDENGENLQPCGENPSLISVIVHDASEDAPRFSSHQIEVEGLKQPLTVSVILDKLRGKPGVYVGTLGGVPTHFPNWWETASFIENDIKEKMKISHLIVQAALKFTPKSQKKYWILFTDTEPHAEEIRDLLKRKIYNTDQIPTIFILDINVDDDFTNSIDIWATLNEKNEQNENSNAISQQNPILSLDGLKNNMEPTNSIENHDFHALQIQNEEKNPTDFKDGKQNYFNLFKIPSEYADCVDKIVEAVNSKYDRNLKVPINIGKYAQPANSNRKSKYFWAPLSEPDQHKKLTSITLLQVELEKMSDGPLNHILAVDKLNGLNGVYVGKLIGIPSISKSWWRQAENIESFIKQIVNYDSLVVEVRLRFNPASQELVWAIYTDSEVSAKKIRDTFLKNTQKFADKYDVICNFASKDKYTYLPREWEIYQNDDDISDDELKNMDVSMADMLPYSVINDFDTPVTGERYFKLLKIPKQYTSELSKIISSINQISGRNLSLVGGDDDEQPQFVQKITDSSDWAWAPVIENSSNAVPRLARYSIQTASMISPISVILELDRFHGLPSVFVGQLLGLPAYPKLWWLISFAIESLVKERVGDKNLIVQATLRYIPSTRQYNWSIYTDTQQNARRIRQAMEANQRLIANKFQPQLQRVCDADNTLDSTIQDANIYEIYPSESYLAESMLREPCNVDLEIPDKMKNMDDAVVPGNGYFKILKVPIKYMYDLEEIIEKINTQNNRKLTILSNSCAVSALPIKYGSQWCMAPLNDFTSTYVPALAKYNVQLPSMHEPIQVQIVYDKLKSVPGLLVGIMNGLPAIPKKWWQYARLIESHIRQLVRDSDLPVEVRLKFKPQSQECVWAVFTDSKTNVVRIRQSFVGIKQKFIKKYDLRLEAIEASRVDESEDEGKDEDDDDDDDITLLDLSWDFYFTEEELAEIQNTNMSQEETIFDDYRVSGDSYFKLFQLPSEYATELQLIIDEINTKYSRNLSIEFSDKTTIAKSVHPNSGWAWALLRENTFGSVRRFARYKVQTAKMQEPVYVQIVEDKLQGNVDVFVGILIGPSTATVKWWWMARLIECFITYIVEKTEILVEVRLKTYIDSDELYWAIFTATEEMSKTIQDAFLRFHKIKAYPIAAASFPAIGALEDIKLVPVENANIDISQTAPWEFYERDETQAESRYRKRTESVCGDYIPDFDEKMELKSDVGDDYVEELDDFHNMVLDGKIYYKIFKIPSDLKDFTTILREINETYNRNLVYATDADRFPRPINDKTDITQWTLCYEEFLPSSPQFKRYTAHDPETDEEFQVMVTRDRLMGHYGECVGILNGFPVSNRRWWWNARALERHIRSLVGDSNFTVEARLRLIKNTRNFKWVIFTTTPENAHRIYSAIELSHQPLSNKYKLSWDGHSKLGYMRNPHHWDILDYEFKVEGQSLMTYNWQKIRNKLEFTEFRFHTGRTFYRLTKLPLYASIDLNETIEQINLTQKRELHLVDEEMKEALQVHPKIQYCWALCYEDQVHTVHHVHKYPIQTRSMMEQSEIMLYTDKLHGAMGVFVGVLEGLPIKRRKWSWIARAIEDYVRNTANNLELKLEARLRLIREQKTWTWTLFTDSEANVPLVRGSLKNSTKKLGNKYIIKLYETTPFDFLTEPYQWDLFEEEDEIAEEKNKEEKVNRRSSSVPAPRSTPKTGTSQPLKPSKPSKSPSRSSVPPKKAENVQQSAASKKVNDNKNKSISVSTNKPTKDLSIINLAQAAKKASGPTEAPKSAAKKTVTAPGAKEKQMPQTNVKISDKRDAKTELKANSRSRSQQPTRTGKN